jgi:hypothetical protein
MTEHSLNRTGAMANSTDEDTDGDERGQRREAEIKRELRKNVVGRGILHRHRELKRR